MKRALIGLLVALTLGTAYAEEPDEEAGQAQINPRYLLMDTRGRAVANEDFAGRFQLVAFGFTSCPAVCPSTLAAMSQILRQLGPLADQVQPLFVTIDPERDTPAVLADYVAHFDARILALSGTPALIARTAEHFQVSYRKHSEPGAAPGDYTMDHSVGLYLIGPDGRFLTRYPHALAPDDVAARLRERLAAYENDPLVLRAQRARR